MSNEGFSKENITNFYRNGYCEKHFGNKKVPIDPLYGCVFGVSEGNIGETICKSLDYVDVNDKCGGLTYSKNILSKMSDIDIDWVAKNFDIFIFCNGEIHLDWIENQPPEKIASVVNNNLTETILFTTKLSQRLIKKETKSKIIFIGSMAHNQILNGCAPYCAAKAGLAHFTRCCAYELYPKGVEVLCIHPASVQDTPTAKAVIEGLKRYRSLIGGSAAEFYWQDGLPTGLHLSKDEIAEVIKRLVPFNVPYLSGSNIELAGGERGVLL